MKKRVLSALLVLCMACSMVSTVWATETNATSGAPEPASQTLNLDNGQPGDESGADSTGAPSDSTDSTSASSDSTSSGSSSAASDATSGAVSDATSGEGDESAASSDSTAASDSTSSSSSASSDSSDSTTDNGDDEGNGLIDEDAASNDGVSGSEHSADSADVSQDVQAAMPNVAAAPRAPGSGSGHPTTIPTADTKDTIQINLFDYDEDKLNGSKNILGNFDFGASRGSEPWNEWTGDYGGVTQGILKNQLNKDGKPVFNGEWREDHQTLGQNGRGAAWLFTKGDDNGKKSYMGLNHLFTYDPTTNEYSYDSSAHFASLVADKENGKDFVVYDARSQDVGGHQVRFAPFNDIDSDGRLLNEEGGRTNNPNYLFGMEISFDFLQPKDGQITVKDQNGQPTDDTDPMEFEFNGDDDVWVFVDGVLVLDLGGIHVKQGGKIDFSTGKVTVYDVDENSHGGSETGIVVRDLKDLFKAAGDTNIEWEEVRVDGETYHRFADYSSHTLSFFYLERGEGHSNCELKFNMPTIPEGSMYVGKQVTKESNVAEFVDSDFKFHVDVQKWNTEETEYENYAPYNGSAKLYNGEIGGGKYVKDIEIVDGEFTLKHNQYVELTDLSDLDQIKVYEYVPDVSDLEQLYDIVVSEKGATKINAEGVESAYGQEGLLVSDNRSVLFTNDCRVANLYNLEISKEGGKAGETYQMQVKIGGELYEGEYFVTDSGSPGIGVEQEANDGIIELKTGQTATIQGVVWGTSFEVEEVGRLGEGYGDPTYSVTNAEEGSIDTNNKASGKIPTDINTENKVTSVVVTNHYTSPTATLTLSKTFDGLSDAEVEYLIKEAKFGWDVNFCSDTLRISYDDKGNAEAITYMADAEDIPDDLRLPGVKDKSDNLTQLTGGGDFSIDAVDYLPDWDKNQTNFKAKNIKGTKASSSFMKDSETGNWTLTITIEVPTTDEHHFYTVFEQHQEVPGYAKINDSNAEYTITRGDIQIVPHGTGKFVDHDVTGNDVYEDMNTEVEKTEKKTLDDKNGEEFSQQLEGEEAAIDNCQLTRLEITEDTTIAFTNHYTGNLDVTKKIGAGNDYTDANTEKYTLTIAPAHLWKLDFEKDATESTEINNINHGLNGKSVSYYIETADGNHVDEEGNTLEANKYAIKQLDANGSFTISVTPDQTIHFSDMPAIQWQVTEDEAKAKVEGYTLDVAYSDSNNSVVNDVTHWNKYVTGDTIGGSDPNDGIASVDSAVLEHKNPDVNPNAVAKVTVTNVYTPNTVILTVNKTVAGSMGDTTNHSEFTFHLTLKNGDAAVTDATISYTVDNGQATTMYYDEEGQYYFFTLSHDETAEITIPYGYTATLQEVEGNGYEVYSRLRQVRDDGKLDGEIKGNLTDENTETTLTAQHFSNSNQISPIEMTQDQECDFVNFRKVVAPTGLESNHTTPYVLMITAAGVAGLALIGAIVSRRIRRRREE